MGPLAASFRGATSHAYVLLAFLPLLALGCRSSSFVHVEDVSEGPPAYERVIHPFPVRGADGQEYRFPFLGGLTVPRPQFVDVNGNGRPDLFVQEYSGSVIFFENVGTREEPEFEWRTDRFEDLDVGEWYRFVDLNLDGTYDILAEAPYSYIRYYRNVGTRTEPRFELAADTLRDVEGRPIFSDRQNILQVTDIDCNGLADLFIGRLDGTLMRYEAVPGDPDAVPVFRLVTERFEDIEIVAQFGQPGVPYQAPDPSGGGPLAPKETRAAAAYLHGANSMAFADVFGAGVQDLYWGDFFEPGLLRIRNTGTCASPSLRTEPQTFPPPRPVASSGYNAPAFVDLHGNGRLDLFVGVLGGAFNPNRTAHANFFFYEHLENGHFELRTTQFLDQIDVGSESVPVLADLTGSGTLDLLVSNKISAHDSRTAILVWFENVGTPGRPEFEMRDTLALLPSYHYAPALGDLNGNGLLDMLVGTWNDGIAYYRNVGTPSRPEFELVEAGFVQITRGSHTTPALVDVNGNGLLDLFIGEASGAINFYRNAGTAREPRFELVSDEYLDINVGRRSAPVFVDVNGNGLYDMIIGSESNGLLLYRNRGTAAEPAFEYAGTFLDDVPPLATPGFGDLTGDGLPELIVGGRSGGLRYFRASAR